MVSLSLLSPQEQSQMERELMQQLEELATALLDESAEDVTGSMVDDAQVQQLLVTLQRLVAYCNNTSNAFLGLEKNVLLLLLPILQTYGQLSSADATGGSGATAQAIDVSGLCCSVFSILVERSLNGLPQLTELSPSDSTKSFSSAPTPIISPQSLSQFFDKPQAHATQSMSLAQSEEAQQCMQHHSQLLAELGQMGWCESLIEILLAHIEEETIAEVILYALSLLLRHGPEINRSLLLRADGVEAIVEALTLHVDSVSIMNSCFEVISLITESASPVREHLGSCGVCEAITEALRAALARCQIQNRECDESDSSNSGPPVKRVTGSATHSNASSYEPPCAVLAQQQEQLRQQRQREAEDEDSVTARQSLINVDLMELAPFVAKACWLVGRLCQGCFENKRLFGECDACNVLVDVLTVFFQPIAQLDARKRIDSATDDAKIFRNSAAHLQQSSNAVAIESASSADATDSSLSSFAALKRSGDRWEQATIQSFIHVLTWCAFAVNELCESHDENQWRCGENDMCLQLVSVLRACGRKNGDLCICLCGALQALIEVNEVNRSEVGIEGQLGQILIDLLHQYLPTNAAARAASEATGRSSLLCRDLRISSSPADFAEDDEECTSGSGAAIVLRLCSLLAVLLRSSSSLSDRAEITICRAVCDCDGGLVLVHVLINFLTEEAVCLRAFQSLVSLLSGLQQDNNEMAFEEIMRSGVMAVCREVMSRFPENDELLEFGELVLDKLAQSNSELVI